jgi:hypothetical protein
MTAACVSRVQLVFSAKGLADEDVLSKSDPFLILRDFVTKRELGRTEVIKDDLNPVWKTFISVDYKFETKQTFHVSLWDHDGNGNHDALGSVEFTMGKLMSTRGSTLTIPVANKRGTITIVGLPQGQIKGSAQLQFRGRQLKNMDTFSKSDPFYYLDRILPNGQTQRLYQSEVIDDNLDPLWKSQPLMDIQTICSGNLQAKVLRFTCFDEDLTSNDYMGEFECSLEELLTPKAEFRLVDPKKPKEFYGYILLAHTNFVKEPDFMELLKAGLQLNIAFSVDFTGSNLEARNPKSLHFYHPTQPNQYIQSMLAVSDVVQEYDSDRQFPCFGFGAILPGSKEANHFFHLNLGPNPYISGMQAVIDTYVQTVQQIRFYGPTNFAPTIRNVANGARQAPGVYTILLIMTDGEITDMNDTIKEIRSAVDAPLSLLIVGVGNADFSSMERLDGDNGTPLASRDMVQFVPMRDFANRAPEELAAALLAEIPKQVSGWATLHPDRFPRPTLLVQSAPINV